ncbi:MAG: hypothetical protein LBJ81_00535 [Puniceicoccales bacterium]|jgi:hypothetical protein|nr:hypothetical protein [Puniceicoccales bacterium]
MKKSHIIRLISSTLLASSSLVASSSTPSLDPDSQSVAPQPVIPASSAAPVAPYYPFSFSGFYPIPPPLVIPALSAAPVALGKPSKWTPDEDATLTRLRKVEKKTWKEIAETLSRSEKTCQNHLSKLNQKGKEKREVHNPWTPEEDALLLQAVNLLLQTVKELGQNNWKIVASRVGKHAPGACRQQWCKLMKKKADQEANAAPPSADPNPTEEIGDSDDSIARQFPKLSEDPQLQQAAQSGTPLSPADLKT